MSSNFHVRTVKFSAIATVLRIHWRRVQSKQYKREANHGLSQLALWPASEKTPWAYAEVRRAESRDAIAKTLLTRQPVFTNVQVHELVSETHTMVVVSDLVATTQTPWQPSVSFVKAMTMSHESAMEEGILARSLPPRWNGGAPVRELVLPSPTRELPPKDNGSLQMKSLVFNNS